MVLRNLSEEVCIVAGWIAITRSLAKVSLVTHLPDLLSKSRAVPGEITEKKSFKSFFSHCPDVLCQERSLPALRQRRADTRVPAAVALTYARGQLTFCVN